MNNHTAPLIARGANDPIALLLSALAPLSGVNGIITAQQFLCHVHCLSKQLPEHQYVINLCENRYLFMVAFAASILRQQTSLLPPNKKVMTQMRLSERYGDVYILHDGLLKSDNENTEIALNIADINVLECKFTESLCTEACPEIPLDYLAAISFTSGSTGDSKPNLKTWRTIIESSEINARHMLESAQSDSCGHATLYQLATVPAQHMWGLETSVLLPLFESICVADVKPLFPQDIYDALQVIPKPRMLVSAPVHLRAMCGSQLEYPDVELVLCATSPLSKELAINVERLFSAQLREVYGCSEVGSMAVRKTAASDNWYLFTGIRVEEQNDGTSIASTDYLPASVVLQDRIEMKGHNYFQLKGRATDMVDIAGKRGSLLEINQVLLNFPGIIDGVVFMPEAEDKRAVARLAALVTLPEGTDSEDLRRYLRQHFDNAFIPRPIIKVDSLPREENGKLPVRQLQDYYQQLLESLGHR